MRKIFLFAALACAAGAKAQNTQALYDSTEVERLQEVVVKGVRAQKNAPYAISNIKKKELGDFSKTGRELPFLFSQTPGVMAWSENGLGTGTTYMRIRGAGDSRINVTLDGVPLNSPEDQCVFWANMNSYGSLLGSVQIQRGVGTSTNGDGAFGGTVALSSATPLQTPSLELSGSYGSYNTFNFGGNFSTGLLWKHWILDGAYHETHTDGFIHGTSGRSGSYYGGLSWVSDDIVVRYKNIGNFERTGQAWNGVTAGDNNNSLMDGMYLGDTGIKTYKDMYDAGLGKFNSLYERFITDEYGYMTPGGPYPTERYRMADGSFWDKTTDNFWQNHNILSMAWNINDRWSTSASLHYTYGYGYYEEFRYNKKLVDYGLQNITYTDGNGDEVTVGRSDFVRKKGLTQHTYGLVWNAEYKSDRWNIVGGLSLQNFDSNHFGYLTYAGNDMVRQTYLPNGDRRYYDSDAHKLDGNVFVKAAYHINDQWDVFADMQYRHVGYKTDGYNDKYYVDDDNVPHKHILDINKKYDFFNPKAGFSWQSNGHRVYGSVAMSHREPERNNFTDNGTYPAPKAEQLMDYELGYTFNSDIFRAGANLYYMDYKDQFVQTGALSDIGENLTTNIKNSYRMGIELQAGVDATPWLSVDANAAISKNHIKNFDEVVEDWRDKYAGDADANADAMAKWHVDGNGDQLRTIHHGNSTLAFSPSVLLNGFVNFHWRGLQAVWHTGFVSRQYLDNTECKDRSLPGYSVTNVNLSYSLKPKKVLKEAVIGLHLNNLFNKRYAASGWVYSALDEKDGYTPDHRYYQIGFIPMAGFTMMGNLTLRF
ncbi:MAG: TonB-dependent receptor plug domain-containing protein [Prevotella sp.]|nr:TonB-dependent receptor plug domain-containing protein [Prevotella sp.]